MLLRRLRSESFEQGHKLKERSISEPSTTKAPGQTCRVCHSIQHMELRSRVVTTFLRKDQPTPILRILPTALLLTAASGATRCDKLGLGGTSPTTPSRPPAAGSTIV